MTPAPDRAFSTHLIASRLPGRRVTLSVGSAGLRLAWPDLRAGEQVEVLADGLFVQNYPLLVAPPAEIPFADIERWGPSSPPNVRWLLQPEDAPDVPPARVLAVVTPRLDYRFLFADEATARTVDDLLTAAIRAAGYTLTTS